MITNAPTGTTVNDIYGHPLFTVKSIKEKIVLYEHPGENMCCKEDEDTKNRAKKIAAGYVKTELDDYLNLMREKLEKRNQELVHQHTYMVYSTSQYNTTYATVESLKQKIAEIEELKSEKSEKPHDNK